MLTEYLRHVIYALLIMVLDTSDKCVIELLFRIKYGIPAYRIQ